MDGAWSKPKKEEERNRFMLASGSDCSLWCLHACMKKLFHLNQEEDERAPNSKKKTKNKSSVPTTPVQYSTVTAANTTMTAHVEHHHHHKAAAAAAEKGGLSTYHSNLPIAVRKTAPTHPSSSHPAIIHSRTPAVSRLLHTLTKNPSCLTNQSLYTVHSASLLSAAISTSKRRTSSGISLFISMREMFLPRQVRGPRPNCFSRRKVHVSGV